jgi:hypothetical protein
MIHGLRPGARVVFIRAGRALAEGTVVVARNGYSIVRLDMDAPGGAVMAGDEVRVVRNGTRDALDAQVAAAKSTRTFYSILVYAMFIALIC